MHRWAQAYVHPQCLHDCSAHVSLDCRRESGDTGGLLLAPAGRGPYAGLLNIRRNTMFAPLLALWTATPPILRGIVLMMMSTVMFSSMHTSIRYLSSDLSPLQIAFFRNFFGVIVFLPLMYRSGIGFMRTKRLGLHVTRCVLNVTSMFAFFTALSMTPIARVTALSFTSPLFMAVISVVLLGEVMRMRRWAATILGFVGAVIIIRPGFAEIDTGSLLVLGSAATWAVCMALIKMLGRTESSMTITGYATLLMSIFSLVPAVMVWKNPEPWEWMGMLFIGVIGTIGQIFVAEALRQADATAVMPFDFLKLIWAAALGYVIFAEIPDLFTWLGAAVIFASGMYIVYRERQLAKRDSRLMAQRSKTE